MTVATDNTLVQKRKNLGFLTFIIALFTAAVAFLPAIVQGNGYFIFFGDFNVQQIPFYQYCHEMVRSGDIGWSWVTDLGSNFIGSYSFYLLGSPFFWITLPFPNWMVPYLMGPLLILKFAFAALTAYLFIRRFTSREEPAVIGGLIYAFSGFSVYNVFFNHFHEALIFFPLLMLAMEVFWAEKRRGALIFAVFFCALTNYYFFFGMVVFTVIYWFIRIFSHSFKFDWGQFFLMLFECVLGLLLAAVVLYPAILVVLQNDRLGSVMSGWSFVLYGKEQIFLNVIECFFFPPDLPARPVFFPGAEVKWSSLGGWMPLFGMVGAITALLGNKKGTWLRRLLVLCIFMALVPGLNSVFSLLNTTYYARWFYMPLLMMALATATALEDTEANWNTAWKWSAAITIGLTVVIGFMPRLDGREFVGLGLYTDARTNPFKFIYQSIRHAFDPSVKVEGDVYDLRFWVACLISLLCLFILRALITFIREKQTFIFKPIIAIICAVSVLYSAFFLISGQYHSYDIDDVMIDSLIEGEVTLDIDDDEFARIDVYDGVDNTGLYLGYPSVNFFNSVVSASTCDYYYYIGVTRTVNSRPNSDYYASKSLTSVKYLLDPQIENSKEFRNQNGDTDMPEYTFVKSEGGYDVYINDCYIPMGFTYDYFITEEQMEKYHDGRRAQMMLKALLIEDGDIADFKPYLKDIDTDYNVLDYSPEKESPEFTYSAYANDCANRRATAGDSFKYDASGFESHITLDKANYVFYSVPYADGWTAYVNGQPAEIKRVNKGFVAVLAHEGENVIEFRFETPGLVLGVYITLGAAAVIVLYLVTVLIVRRFRPVTPPEYPEGDVIASRIALFEATANLSEQSTGDLLDDIDHDKINAYPGFEGGFTIDESALLDFNSFAKSEPAEKEESAQEPENQPSQEDVAEALEEAVISLVEETPQETSEQQSENGAEELAEEPAQSEKAEEAKSTDKKENE